MGQSAPGTPPEDTGEQEQAVTVHFESIEQVIAELKSARYIADRALATVLFLSHRLEKPIFLKANRASGRPKWRSCWHSSFDTEMIRLQCYEGLDASSALYEWNYSKQLLHIRLEERGERGNEEIEQLIYSPKFLIKRPLLEAILRSEEKPTVLLIDEIDRSDEEFEAFLLEVLSEFQITIPEIGTLRARRKPMVVVTSNPPGTCMMPSSEGASTTGSSTPPTKRNMRSSGRGSRASRSSSPPRSRGSCSGCVRLSSSSGRGFPRRSTGRRRSSRCTGRISTRRSCARPWVCILKYQEDIKRFNELVDTQELSSEV